MKIGSVMAGRADVGAIVPAMLNWIVSNPAVPAEHSPSVTPEAALLLAAMIASRNVHWPSSAATSAVPLTVIVAPETAAGSKRAEAKKEKFANHATERKGEGLLEVMVVPLEGKRIGCEM